jgi:predicted nuclease with TOPRIM domain
MAFLQGSLDDLNRAHAPCHALIGELKSQIDDLQLQLLEVAKLRSENEELKSRLKTLEGLAAENAELKVELAALIKECDQLRSDHSTCDETIANLMEDVESLRRELSQCKEKIASLQQELEEKEAPVVIQKQSRHAAQRAAPVIQYSQRILPSSSVPSSNGPKIVGLGMVLKQSFENADPRLNGRMVITEVAEGGGAFVSGRIRPGDILLGVAPTPDQPVRTPQVPLHKLDVQ